MKLNDIWAYAPTSNVGIFHYLLSVSEDAPEWLTGDTAGLLDYEYHLNRSGAKSTSPIAEHLALENVDHKLNDNDKALIAELIWLKYGRTWDRFYADHLIEYAPIENYSMIEVETPDITMRHGASDDYKVTVDDQSDTDIHTNTSDEREQIGFGFNSTDGAPESLAGSGIVNEVYGDADHNKTHRETSQTGFTEDTETGTRKLTRSGNIGVTTSQQMLQSDLDLWGAWNFYDLIMKDIDNELTLAIYNYR